MGYLDKRLGVFVFGISGCFSMALQAQTVPNQGAVVVPGQGAAKTTVGGQPGVTGNTPIKADPVLDQYLLRWEQEMTKVQTLVAKLQLIEVDKTFGARKTSLGMAKYMKAGSQIAPVSLALLELRKRKQTGNRQKIPMHRKLPLRDSVRTKRDQIVRASQTKTRPGRE